MYIESIDIENLHNVKLKHYEFEPGFNYLWGPNGSGKSTVLEAIQFCLLGTFPNTAKTNTGSYKHSNGDDIKVTLTLDDAGEDIFVTRNLKKVKNSYSNVLTISPGKYELSDIVQNLSDLVLDFNEFLSLTANKQKDYLTSLLPTDSLDLNIAKLMPKRDRKFEDELIQGSGTNAIKSAEDLKAVNTYLKEMKSEVAGEIKRVNSTIQSLVYYSDYSGPDSLVEIDSKISEISELLNQANKSTSESENLENINTQLAKLPNFGDSLYEYPEYASSLRDYKQLQSEFTGLNMDHDINKAKQLKLNSEISQLADLLNSDAICPFTQAKCTELANRISNNEAKLEKLKAQLAEIESAQSVVDHKLKSNLSLSEHYKDSIQKLESDYSRYTQLKAKLADINPSSVVVDTSVLQADLDSYMEIKAQFLANQRYLELKDNLIAERTELENKQELVKELQAKTGENGIISEILSKPFDELKQEMNRISDKCKLSEIGAPEFIIEAKANSFDFGYQRNDKFISFSLLSSGEKCVFLMTFLAAVIKVSKSNISFILIDDALDHLDDTRFKNIVDNFEANAQIQAIAAGVKFKISDNIKMINIGGNL